MCLNGGYKVKTVTKENAIPAFKTVTKENGVWVPSFKKSSNVVFKTGVNETHLPGFHAFLKKEGVIRWLKDGDYLPGEIIIRVYMYGTVRVGKDGSDPAVSATHMIIKRFRPLSIHR